MKEISEIKKYTLANREAWNEAMPKHQIVKKDYWDEQFLKHGFCALNEIELSYWELMGVKGKDIAHLCCNNGIELLSLKNLGAGRCTGFDICDAAVEEAIQRAKKSSIDCEFIRTDVFDIPAEYNNKYDIVYITVGALIWIPDLQLFFKKASDLLRKDGHLFIYEEHPFVMMFDDDLTICQKPGEKEEENILKVKYPYFKEDAWIDNSGIDYIGKTIYEGKTNYVFTHTMSDIITAIIDNSIEIKLFKEFSDDITNNMNYFEKTGLRVPLSYILIGDKK